MCSNRVRIRSHHQSCQYIKNYFLSNGEFETGSIIFHNINALQPASPGANIVQNECQTWMLCTDFLGFVTDALFSYESSWNLTITRNNYWVRGCTLQRRSHWSIRSFCAKRRLPSCDFCNKRLNSGVYAQSCRQSTVHNNSGRSVTLSCDTSRRRVLKDCSHGADA